MRRQDLILASGLVLDHLGSQEESLTFGPKFLRRLRWGTGRAQLRKFLSSTKRVSSLVELSGGLALAACPMTMLRLIGGAA